MNEKKDRTILVVSLIVIAGMLLSSVGGCLAGGLAGFLLARREARHVAEQLEGLAIPEIIERDWDFEFREIPEGVPEFEFPQVPDPDEFREELPPFSMPRGEGQLSGAWVQEVVPGSPAEAAGLRPDDLIIAVDGRTVDRNHPLEALIAQYEPGDRVEITYLRGDDEDEVSVRLSEHPEDPRRAYLGVYFVAISMQQRFERNIEPSQPSG